jgi:hypothetical protein
VKMSTVVVGLRYVGFTNSTGVVAGVRIERLAISIGPIRVGSKTEAESSLGNIVFLNKRQDYG